MVYYSQASNQDKIISPLLGCTDLQIELNALGFDKTSRAEPGEPIADLDNSPNTQQHHIAEAVRYRNLDCGDWAEK